MAAISGLDNFLRCFVEEDRIGEYKKMHQACNLLSYLYGKRDKSAKWGDLSQLISGLLQSQTIKGQEYLSFRAALSLLGDEDDREEVLEVTNLHEPPFIIREVVHLDHVAFVIIDCDADRNVPLRISYCDAWKGLFGVNKQKYSFGETVFEIDPAKVKTAAEIKEKIAEHLDGKNYPTLDEMNAALANFVKCDDKGIPIVVEKHLPCRTQSGNNCFLKSLLLAMRATARRVDVSLDDDLQWSKEFEEDGFPEFGEADLKGSGRQKFKSFKSDLTDECIVILHEGIAAIRERHLLDVVRNQVLEAYEKTQAKFQALQARITKAAIESTGKYQHEEEIEKVYCQRIGVLESCLRCINVQPKEKVRNVKAASFKAGSSIDELAIKSTSLVVS